MAIPNEQAMAILQSELSAAQTRVDALTTALALLTTGYQSDQSAIEQAIESGIAERIDAAIEDAVAPLNDQIADLNVQVADFTRQLDTPLLAAEDLEGAGPE